MKIKLRFVSLLDLAKLSVIFMCCQAITCLASPVEDFGEAAGSYVGSCIGSEFVKQRYCPKLQAIPTAQCMQTVSEIMIPKYQTEFAKIMRQNTSDEKAGVISDFETVYLKILQKHRGNVSRACENYQEALQNLQYRGIEKLKMIVKYIK